MFKGIHTFEPLLVMIPCPFLPRDFRFVYLDTLTPFFDFTVKNFA